MTDGWTIATAIGTVLAAASAAAGLWVTVYTFRRTVAIKVNDDLSKQALECLRIAYDVLTESGREIPPPQSRINWLTSARQIVRFQQLRDQLQGTARTIVDESEVVYRHRFYMALRGVEQAYGYFDIPPGAAAVNSDNAIQPKSAAIVIGFSQWPVNLDDPLDAISFNQISKERGAFVFRHRAFKDVFMTELNNEHTRKARVGKKSGRSRA